MTLCPVARSKLGSTSSSVLFIAVVQISLISGMTYERFLSSILLDYTPILDGLQCLAGPIAEARVPSSELDLMTAVELRRKIARREISAVEVTRRALEKAQATQSSLNAFFFLMPDEAMAAAQAADEAREAR